MVRGVDLGFATITIVLACFGLAALYGFSLNQTGEDTTLLIRQVIAFIISLAVAVVLIRADYRWLAGVHWVLYGLGMVALVAVLFFGRTINGTTGWFSFGGLQLQPVELVKVIMAIWLAKYLSDHVHELHRWSILARSGLGILGPVLLIMWQPDLGSALILIGSWIALMVVLPVPRRFLAVLLLGAIVIGLIGWFGFLQPYQKDRIQNFLNPTQDRLGTGYNVQQAITAIGSGQFFGRGLALGTQSQLNYLPARQTDFIFAAVGEELGFLGASVILILFGLFFWRLARLLRSCRDNFSLILGTALALMFFWQVLINIGMNMGLFPVAGIPLPFISYGGSSLLASFIAVGLLESMAVRQRTAPL